MENEKSDKNITKTTKNQLDENSFKNGILSFIGCVFHKIAISSVFIGFSFSTYIISYLHYFQDADEKPLTQQHTYLFLPIISVTMGLCMPFSGFLEFKLGTQRTIILGSIFLIISSAIEYVTHNFYLCLLGILIYSFGIATSIAISGKNTCMYFPTRRGMVSGLLALISSIIGSILNMVGEKVIVNPDSIGPKDGYYLFDVSKNILKYYLFQMSCIGVCTLLCILFIVPFQITGDMAFTKKGNKKPKKDEANKDSKPIETNTEKSEPLLPEENQEEQKEKENNPEDKKEEKEKEKEENEIINEGNKEEKEKEKEEEQQEEKKEEQQEEKKEDNNGEEEKKEKNENENKPIEVNDTNEIKDENKENEIKEIIPDGLGGQESSFANGSVNYSMNQIKNAAKMFRVWRLFLMGVFSTPLNNFLIITWRPISIFKEMDTNKIQKVNSFNGIIQMIVQPVFGYLADKIPYRVVLVSLGTINCLVGFLFYFSFGNVNFFIALLLLNTFANQGMMVMNEPHYMKVFGMKHYIEISGIIRLSGVIMSPICTLFAFFIESYFSDNLDTVYKYMFIVSGCLQVVNVVLSIFEGEDPLFEE